MLSQLAYDYLPIAVLLAISFGLGGVIVFLPFFTAKKNPYDQKNATYECGFREFSDTRMKFDVRFYLVSMLFIIFDLEIAFMVPWSIALKEIGTFGFFSMMIFLFILVIGFVYEWRKKALDW